MIEVTVDSVRVSLLSAHRLVVLKEVGAERYLPIWIGPFEADAITIKLQGMEISRPLTHDLLKNVIEQLGAVVSHVLISELTDNTFYARIVMDVDGRHTEVDSRTSDAIALAVRMGVPIFVADEVMAQAAITPSPSLEPLTKSEEDEDLSVFRDFIEGLDDKEEEE